jgi:hypothetical protein
MEESGLVSLFYLFSHIKRVVIPSVYTLGLLLVHKELTFIMKHKAIEAVRVWLLLHLGIIGVGST